MSKKTRQPKTIEVLPGVSLQLNRNEFLTWLSDRQTLDNRAEVDIFKTAFAIDGLPSKLGLALIEEARGLLGEIDSHEEKPENRVMDAAEQKRMADWFEDNVGRCVATHITALCDAAVAETSYTVFMATMLLIIKHLRWLGKSVAYTGTEKERRRAASEVLKMAREFARVKAKVGRPPDWDDVATAVQYDDLKARWRAVEKARKMLSQAKARDVLGELKYQFPDRPFNDLKASGWAIFDGSSKLRSKDMACIEIALRQHVLDQVADPVQTVYKHVTDGRRKLRQKASATVNHQK